MRRRGASVGSWVERLASVTAISVSSSSGAPQTLPRSGASGLWGSAGGQRPKTRCPPRAHGASPLFELPTWPYPEAYLAGERGPAHGHTRPSAGVPRNSRCRREAPQSAWLSHSRAWSRHIGDTNTCSHAFRPQAVVLYEHMFCSSRKTGVPLRLMRTLQLVRSFLLLEDDYDVDWEVDQDEWTGESSPCSWESSDDQCNGRGAVHPHRMALRSRLGARRPGIVASAEQVCLCPVGGRARAGVPRGSFSPKRSCAAMLRGAGSSRNP